MLKRINELLESEKNFAFETTLATKSYKTKIMQAKAKIIMLLFYFFGCKM